MLIRCSVSLSIWAESSWSCVNVSNHQINNRGPTQLFPTTDYFYRNHLRIWLFYHSKLRLTIKLFILEGSHQFFHLVFLSLHMRVFMSSTEFFRIEFYSIFRIFRKLFWVVLKIKIKSTNIYLNLSSSNSIHTVEKLF